MSAGGAQPPSEGLAFEGRSEDPTLEIIDRPAAASLIELLAAWNAWPKVGRVPRRSAFDPVAFPRLLPWIGLVEFHARPNRYRDYDALYRYVGSARAEMFRTSGMTRSYMSELQQGGERWFAVYDRLIADAGPLVVRGRPYLVGRDFMRFEMLMLPLGRDKPVEDDRVAYILSLAHFAA
ncbi:MAG TPA: hypothetical protein VMW18_05695 [Candidatus Binatia bacterium]|nr:hypothetical protein [Candidatus Binatia bacterium]